jgi:excisionase family DNA binding protein
MPGDLLNTREVAEHLGVNEKQVYALVKAGRLPATRLTGKWMFPRRLLDEWIEADARRSLAGTRERTRGLDRALLVAGSDDPVLALLAGELRKGESGVLLFLAATGSTEGLRALDRGDIDVALSHLHDPVSGEYNLPFLPRLVSRRAVAAINLFHREIGLVTRPEGSDRIRTIADLRAEGIRLVNRQPGSGTRVLLEHELATAGLTPSAISGWDSEVDTHHEVALAVKAGEADVGVATASVARLFGLRFVPLREERFDMVVDRAVYFERRFQALLDRLVSPAFRDRACRIGGYDFRSCGSVLTRDP